MKYFIRYGNKNSTIDITEQIIENIVNDRYYHIPKLNDNERADLYGDPCFGTVKSIIITSDEGHLFYIDPSEYAYIDIKDEILYLNELPTDIVQ